MSNVGRALVVGASEEELSHIRTCLADWECPSAELGEDQRSVLEIPATLDVVVVHARKSEPDTLALCEHFRSAPQSAAVPILLVIGRYEITQGSAIMRMGNAAWLMAPFKEKELSQRIAQLREAASSGA
jgi:response regulator RpfG family c-di-GMP phosphodiesterase